MAVLIVLGACSSGGQTGSPDPVGPLVNQPVPLPATPADIPSAAPQCADSTSVVVQVPSSLDGLVSACASQSGDEVIVTNLSEFVLDVTGYNNTSPQLTVKTYNISSQFLLADEDQLEIEEQNAAVTDWQPTSGMVFLPVGGQVVATSSQPVQLAVQLDPEVSATSFGAELMTAYVVDGLPEHSVLSYYASIASCVNDAYSLWNKFTQQPPASAADMMQQALQTVASCQQLQQKLATDPAAEQPDSDGLQPDLATAAEHAGQKDWESESEDAPHDDYVPIG